VLAASCSSGAFHQGLGEDLRPSFERLRQKIGSSSSNTPSPMLEH
jgi:hypothetical protein